MNKGPPETGHLAKCDWSGRRGTRVDLALYFVGITVFRRGIVAVNDKGEDHGKDFAWHTIDDGSRGRDEVRGDV